MKINLGASGKAEPFRTGPAYFPFLQLGLRPLIDTSAKQSFPDRQATARPPEASDSSSAHLTTDNLRRTQPIPTAPDFDEGNSPAA
jgi:hypothetical protein